MRTDIVVDGGVAYFGAGIFPHDGTFIYALDARTGKRIWRNGAHCETLPRWSLAPVGHIWSTATNLYHIAQESVHNAVRHAESQNISIELASKGDMLALRVRDDGRGIPDSPNGDGMGLRIMHHRAEVIGGRLDIQQADGGGTLVTCRLIQEKR